MAPTILEAAGLPEPLMVNGVQQAPIEGTSMLYTFGGTGEPERHDLQYFEMFGNRGIYHKGWSAVTKHRTPWVMVGGVIPAFDDDVWELYDGSTDYSQSRDLSADDPERLALLQRLWLIEATKHNVLPLDDRTGERLDPGMAGRPTLIRGTSQLFFPGMGRLSENSVVSIKNKSFSVTADVDVPDAGVAGVVIAQGGRFGGWAVYVKDGRLAFVYNVLGIHEFTTVADEPVPAGRHQLRMEFAYDGGGLAKGGDVTLFHDGTLVGTGRVGGDPADGVLRRRDHGHRPGDRDDGDAGLHRPEQPVHRPDPVGPARRRHGRPRPPHLARRAPARRHGPAVTGPDTSGTATGGCCGPTRGGPGIHDADAVMPGPVGTSGRVRPSTRAGAVPRHPSTPAPSSWARTTCAATPGTVRAPCTRWSWRPSSWTSTP